MPCVANYHGGGAFTSANGRDHEGRKILFRDVAVGSGGESVFVAGVPTVTGKGRQFRTLRFAEE